MDWNSSLRGLAFAVLGLAVLVPAPAGAQEIGVDADLDLVVEMPVAVAEALDAGVPPGDLSLLTEALIDGGVPPADFIEVVTLSPVLYRADAADLEAEPVADLSEEVVAELEREQQQEDGEVGRLAAPGPGMGDFVLSQIERGLRGTALADAIQAELGRRGVPGKPGKERIGVRGGDRVVVDPGALELRRRGDDRDRPAARGRDQAPPGHVDDRERGKGGPPGDARGRGRGKARGADPPGQAGEPPGEPPGKGRGDGDRGGER